MAVIYFGGVITALFLFWKNRKWRKYAAVWLIGSVLAFCMRIGELAESENAAVTRIKRGESDQMVALMVKAGEGERRGAGETGGILLEIERQDLSKEELEELEQSMWEELEQKILGKNDSFDCVTEPLYFPEQEGAYPFLLTWNSEKPELLLQDGTLGEKIPLSGETIGVHVRIYEEKSGFEKERTFFVKLYPSQTWQAYLKRLEAYLQTSQTLTTDEEQYILPSNFEDKQLVFETKKEQNSQKVFLGSVLIAVITVFWAGEEEKKKAQQKKEEFEKAYPKLAVRMAMLSDTGLTVSGALKRITGEYGRQQERQRQQEKKQKKRQKKQQIMQQPLYEELIITCREMESGVYEKAAYQNLARRCAVPCMTRFSALLVQYVQSGASGLKRALKEEAERALKEKRERVRKKGEEAGTKLLIPMMLMLVLVMVIIMIPAITSFGL